MHGLRSGVAATVQRTLTYNRGMLLAGASLRGIGSSPRRHPGLALRSSEGLRLSQVSYPAILGLLLITLGFQTFGFTLLLEMSQRVAARQEP